jgi:hypothetical protein
MESTTVCRWSLSVRRCPFRLMFITQSNNNLVAAAATLASQARTSTDALRHLHEALRDDNGHLSADLENIVSDVRGNLLTMWSEIIDLLQKSTPFLDVCIQILAKAVSVGDEPQARQAADDGTELANVLVHLSEQVVQKHGQAVQALNPYTSRVETAITHLKTTAERAQTRYSRLTRRFLRPLCCSRG